MNDAPLVRLGQGDFERQLQVDDLSSPPRPRLVVLVLIALTLALITSAGGPAATRPTPSAPGAVPGAAHASLQEQRQSSDTASTSRTLTSLPPGS